MSSIDEKRRFNTGADTEVVLVATETGPARVAVAGDRVGEVGVVRRCVANDLAVADGLVAVATDEGVIVSADPDRLADADVEQPTHSDAERPTNAGTVTAVGIHEKTVLAADAAGRVVGRERTDEDGWTRMEDLEGVAAIDGDLIAATGGVYRVTDDDLRHAGLERVRDVAGGVVPHAATATGLYRLANGWVDALDGDVRTVAVDAATADAGTLGRAHAATAGTFYEHADGEWRSVELSTDERIADVAHGTGTYAVTTDGTLLADAGDGWHRHVLGLAGATATAAWRED